MQLIADGAFVTDAWTRVADDAPLPVAGDRIVPWARWLAEGAAGVAPAPTGRLGVEIENDTPVAALAPWLPHLDLVVVRFPATGDGRGFSLARRLRARGFRGELRASGALIADQYAFARACGFDTVEIPDATAARQPASQWRRAQREIDRAYQPGYGAGASILEARHAGQAARPELPPALPADPRAESTPPRARRTAVEPTIWWAHW